MKKRLIFILYNKNSIYIFILFLLFFPLKTQLQNVLIMLFDAFITEGSIQRVFGINYKGNLSGCLKSVTYRELTAHFNWFQKYGVYYLQLHPSIIAFLFLLNRWKKEITFNSFDWFLVIVSCFCILESIELFLTTLLYFNDFSTAQLLISIPYIIIFISMGIFIFFKVFNLKEKLLTLVVALPSFYLSSLVWFQYIGPSVLPIS